MNNKDKEEILTALGELIILRNEEINQYNLQTWINEFDKMNLDKRAILDTIDFIKTKPTYNRLLAFTDFLDYYRTTQQEARYVPTRVFNEMLAHHFKHNFKILNALSLYFYGLEYFDIKERNKLALLLDDKQRNEMYEKEKEKEVERSKGLTEQAQKYYDEFLKKRSEYVEEVKSAVLQAFTLANPTALEKEMLSNPEYLKSVLNETAERFFKKIFDKWK